MNIKARGIQTDLPGKVYVVIFAGGTGSRMKGAVKPKQFLELGGKPIIAHTLQHFQKNTQINAVAISCYTPYIGLMNKIIEDYNLDKVKEVVPGGDTGQDSIFNALKALRNLERNVSSKDIVLVHDGVRPLINQEIIDACIKSVRQKGCTAVTAPVTETVVMMTGEDVEEVVDRSKCLLARAPQGFYLRELIEAHEKARAEGIHDTIDSISLMARYGYKIHTIPGPEENIKITTPRDFFTFKSFVDMEEMAQLWN